MRIYTTLKIGKYHTNHCEDYLLTAEIGENRLLCAVMDGCSMGTDSYFAATLTGKILRRIAKECSYKEFATKEQSALNQLLQKIVHDLFIELRRQKNQLQLDRYELLNTLVIAVVDIANRTAEFLCVGDGLICINNELFEFEQNNQPDYLGYHLEEDFNTWYSNQKQRISAKDIKDFSLASDGIFTFKKFYTAEFPEPGDIIELLLTNKNGAENTTMLDAKLIDIEKDWGLKPADDLAIIRVRI